MVENLSSATAITFGDNSYIVFLGFHILVTTTLHIFLSLRSLYVLPYTHYTNDIY